jgi:Transposase DDE domain
VLLYGYCVGVDELPEALASNAGRLARLRQAKAQLEAEATARERAYQPRVAAYTAAAQANGRKPGQLKRRPSEAPNPKATANITDPDSRFLHTRNGTVQGYNAQAATSLNQLVAAAELTNGANDVHQLEPMLAATATTLAAAGIDERPEAALADSGYWSIANLKEMPNAPDPPARHGRQGKPRKDGKPSASRSDGPRIAMTAKLAGDDGKARYAKRRETVEPVFGQIKKHRVPAGSCAAECKDRWIPTGLHSTVCCGCPVDR